MKYHLLFLFLLFSACANEKLASDNYDWLEGNWESKDGRSSETWNKISKQSYNGIGYRHDKDTTTISEYLRLYVSDNKWKLETKVIGQNNGQTITFTQTKKSSGTDLGFQNLNHDYPKTITYQFRNKDGYDVYLNKGLEKEVVYNFSRVEEIKNLLSSNN